MDRGKFFPFALSLSNGGLWKNFGLPRQADHASTRL